MINRFIIIIFIAVYAVTALANSSNDAKIVLADVREELIRKIDFNAEDMAKFSNDFNSYYIEHVRPNLHNLIQNTRIIFVNMKPNHNKEAILIGDMVRTSAWGPKNFIAIATNEKDQGWKIVLFKELEGSINCDKKSRDCHFQYFTLGMQPNNSNTLIGLVLGYANYGISGSSYFSQFVGWDRYADQYYVYEVNTPWPMIVDKNWYEQKIHE